MVCFVDLFINAYSYVISVATLYIQLHFSKLEAFVI